MATAGFEGGGGAASQGMRVASRSWKSQEDGVSLGASRKERSPDILSLALWGPFQNSDLDRLF